MDTHVRTAGTFAYHTTVAHGTCPDRFYGVGVELSCEPSRNQQKVGQRGWLLTI